MTKPNDAARPRRPMRGTVGPQYTRAYTNPDDDLMADKAGSRIVWTASTPGPKRDLLDLRANGWRVDNYHRAGGPVLWAHMHDRPAIGAGQATPEEKRLRVGVVFDQEDEFARSVESKVRRKIIRGSSVGWDFVTAAGEVIEHHRMSARTLARDAFYDLSEFSIVNVPADPLAVAERQRHALQRIDSRLADLYDAQERADSDASGPEIRSAVLALCQRFGIDVSCSSGIAASSRGRFVRADDIPELLRSHGIAVPEPTRSPAEAGDSTLSASAAVDESAARTVLAAFDAL